MDLHDIRTLFAYNRWSNARLLDATARLTDEEFRAPGALPHGGLRGTLVHTLFAEWVWRKRWQGTPPHHAFRFGPAEFPTVSALRERWADEEGRLMELVEGLTDERLHAAIEYTPTEGGRHRRALWEPWPTWSTTAPSIAPKPRPSSPSSATPPATSTSSCS